MDKRDLAERIKAASYLTGQFKLRSGTNQFVLLGQVSL